MSFLTIALWLNILSLVLNLLPGGSWMLLLFNGLALGLGLTEHPEEDDG